VEFQHGRPTGGYPVSQLPTEARVIEREIHP
jgi:hypothetical protein